MNTKKLAGLIRNMLFDGMKQHWLEPHPSLENDIVMFCAERANNIAQAMPELLAECTDEKKLCGMTFNQYKSMTDQCAAAVKSSIQGVERWPGNSSIVGVQPGESSDE